MKFCSKEHTPPRDSAGRIPGPPASAAAGTVGYNSSMTHPRPYQPEADSLRLHRARFAELTPFEVYGLCRLRVDVFVVEQQCPYPELDGRDVEPATVHLWFEADGEVLATIRVLDNGASRSIGRVSTAMAARGQGLAARLMEEGIALCGDVPITIGAQAYLEGWYEQFGFRRSGPGYVEDGIPHVPMRREPA
jgi:ElaA protein